MAQQFISYYSRTHMYRKKSLAAVCFNQAMHLFMNTQTKRLSIVIFYLIWSFVFGALDQRAHAALGKFQIAN